jgi:heptosyltransferase-2
VGLALYLAVLPQTHPGAIILEEGRGIRDRLALIKKLRKYPLERALLFQNAMGAAVTALLSGAKERVGYARHGRGPLLTRGVKPTKELLSAHESFYHLNLLDPDGAKDPPFRFPKVCAHPEATHVHEGPDAGLILAVAPGASFGPAKRAPLETLAWSALEILAGTKGTVIILGSQTEKEDGIRLSGLLGDRVRTLDLSGRTTITELISILKRTDLLIGNDSGLMHLAAACGASLLALFGPTNPLTTGPLGPRSEIVRSPVPCSPCLKRVCPLKKRICFEGITAKDIADRALRLLKPGPPREGGPGIILAGGIPGGLWSPGTSNNSFGDKDSAGNSLTESALRGRGSPPREYRLPQGADIRHKGAYLALAAKEGLGLASSAVVSSDPEALRVAKALGAHTVLYLEGKLPEGLLESGFLPNVTAPSLPPALSYAREYLSELISELAGESGR